ncbi:alpha/beta fold hydrolase [Rhodopseudomonas boonkerdii]|uniref:alpha/beta fold hydrolase n=1 Tax=Rhodopseudomonas boonkerdii TaxID=475937 RepID=UPI001E5C0106|nr:alpha/beta fold hydrolase [Rhodopseudomonas boonkerdii]UGV26804.1 alpha/beta fold hydrolase [Rhodopseudomonas boonkerdii]
MSVFERLVDHLTAALVKPEVEAFSRGLSLRVRFTVGDQAHDVIIGTPPADSNTASEIGITASADDWALVLAEPAPPTYHSFSSIQLRNSRFTITGDPLAIAQARACFEAIFANLTSYHGVESPFADLSRLTGSYHSITNAAGRTAQIYSEEAGAGTPVLCLHTAGADTRQFHGVMCDPALGDDWRLIGFDMPFHGRSMPPAGWTGEAYLLNQQTYLDWCVSFIEQIVREPVIVMGCSMGAGIAMVLAAERPDLVRAVIALEAPLRPRGRRNGYLTHAKVNGGWHSAAYVRGLLGPRSPAELRRRAAYIYSQGAPGIYDGDLAFYSDEFDGEQIAKQIDGRIIPVSLLIGHYDFSATVDDAYQLAGWIEHARVIEMPELGHFPMTENPAEMLRYLRPVFASLKRSVG